MTLLKYELLLDDSITLDGHILYRIRALRSFGNVKKGDIGGYIEGERNLVHYGTAWIFNNACVYEFARVHDNAIILDDAHVYGHSKIYNESIVKDHAKIYDYAEIYHNSVISDQSCVYEFAKVFDYAKIENHSQVKGEAQINGYSIVCDSAIVTGNADLSGCTIISNDAVVSSNNDYFVFKNSWSSFTWLTYTRSNKLWKIDCFSGTSDELITKAYKDSKLSGDCYSLYTELVDKLEISINQQIKD